MTSTTGTDTRDIGLAVFSTAQHKCWSIRFANEALALAWIEAHPWTVDGVRSNTYVTGEASDLVDEGVTRPITLEQDPELAAYLYPVCEHGMSADLCYGPGHYPPDRY